MVKHIITEEELLELINNFPIHHRLLGSHGQKENKTVTFSYFRGKISFIVEDHREIVGEYDTLREAVEHYNRI